MTPLYAMVLLALAGNGCHRAATITQNEPTSLSAVEALAGGGELEGHARALTPRPLIFPEDHGPHPDFKTEWWYFTGHLESPSSAAYGFQLTFFRSALAPAMPPRTSSWATRQLYMAHFALSDLGDQRFFAFERLSRGAAGLAGAQADPLRVWLEDWSLEGSPGASMPWRLHASATATDGREVSLEVELTTTKPLVLHGDQGLSRKGNAPGQASFYYSFTRLAAQGSVDVAGQRSRVTGQAWLDREWSTSVLSENQVGWDWFSLQLDDGRELMFFQLRETAGGIDPLSHGTLVAVDGSSQTLRSSQVELEVLKTWTSPRGITYPAAWRASVDPEDAAAPALKLTIEPILDDQELGLSFIYWEGAVRIRGRQGEQGLSGKGYVELVGYDRPSGEAPLAAR